ncbi:quinone oxidoreductase family protein [Companilactobacillus metriopterae]|uniref:quinone oxidoreductase family protein n=1 Tax=Companilactobacillus metriopterae TaxID=1909267 RepID=UPI00100B74DD|nr:zinc-binding alcohol dehydrogenase family protein [Companilactobacillus metriopterae]
MKAAIIKEQNTIPTLGNFKNPENKDKFKIVNVTATALSNFSKSSSMGKHYSSTNEFPLIAGTDGVGTLEDGTRIYFGKTEKPYGSIAEQTLVNEKLILPIPDNLDDVTAAAIANPGMSSWAALKYRAQIKAGQVVLINGATGVAGSLAIKVARELGAKKVFISGRNEDNLKKLDAEGYAVIGNNFENDLNKILSDNSIDIVLDYLWGESSLSIMKLIATASSGKPTKFVSIGTASGETEINLPSTLLRSSMIEILGSGVRSVSMKVLFMSISELFDWAGNNNITVPTSKFSIEQIEEAWSAPNNPRAVIVVK